MVKYLNIPAIENSVHNAEEEIISLWILRLFNHRIATISSHEDNTEVCI